MNLNATILGQAISFFLFVWFCMRYVWPPIMLAIETRQKEIKESLVRTKKAREKLSIIENDIQKKIETAKIKASVILNEANKQKLLILEEAKNQALEESKKIFLKAESDIEIKIINARKNLHKEITQLSITMAEKIIKKHIHKDNKKNFLNDLILSLSQVNT
ncbi:ATP F0F1 synthase subunit B [Buchnera aphidicola (Diuraphis noxia)]|uniref:ATP synthase subunit b n=1 Tax=Buchnera aphidicola subsp. Diuraphis noxia TaxID=118101 RepID=A0A1B2H7U5_BUCDN|nr:F0F1 ATP synthase subunit B [Buchnera aphidicola]ANZ22260.1 ATP F0F1 synthase subunit B [Buchnera aphidicola (Diuraphis noxia)]